MPTLILSIRNSLSTALAATWMRIKNFARIHKAWSLVIAIAVLGGAWYAYGAMTNTSGIPRYALAQVQSGTFIASVSGTGQVSASSAVALTPQASGKLISINVRDGAEVEQGQLIASIDPTNAFASVRDAKAALQSSQIALQKLQEPATQLSATQAQNAVSQAQADLADAQDTLNKDYSNAATDITNTYLDLPDVISGLKDVNFGSETNHSAQWNIDFYENAAVQYDVRAKSYRDDAYNDYQTALAAYTEAYADYKAANLASADPSTTENELQETSATVTAAQTAVKSATALIQLYSDELTAHDVATSSVTDSTLSTLASYTDKLQTQANALLADTNALKADKNAITSDQQSLTEKQLSLQQLQSGPDKLDVQSSELDIQEKQNALTDAENTLANYYVRAPFAGTVALGDIAIGQQLGSGDTVATVVTQNQIADISLNEVDAAKIKVGDPVTLTFSAIPDLTIAGAVGDISPIGTVSQGVVSYDIKIGFATQDSRVKPGMSVSASIVMEADQNALMVPSTAVHSAPDGSSYVLVFDPPLATSTATGRTSAASGVTTTQTPMPITVTVGNSNNTQTEITSGLSAGQQIIVRTITASSASAASTAAQSTGGARAGGTNATFRGGGAGGAPVFIRGG